MTVSRGALVAFDPTQYLATVRFDASAPQALAAIAVSPGIPASELVAGRRVLVEHGLSGEAGELVLFALASGVGNAPSVLGRAVATLDVVNTIVETSLGSVSVPANALRTDRAVRLTLVGDYLNNSGVARTVTLRVKLGATTLYNDATVALAANAARRPLRAELLIANLNASNVQALGGAIALGSAGGATAGLGDLAIANIAEAIISGSAAEDTTTAKTFEITAQHQVAAATISVRRLYAVWELL